MTSTLPDASSPGDRAVDLTRPTDKKDAGSDAPKLPHDRDQAVGVTDGQRSEVVEQASRDVERGLEDTSRGAETDRAYQKQK